MNSIKKTFLILLATAAIGSGAAGCATTGRTAKEPAHLEAVVINAGGSEYSPTGFKIPDVERYKAVEIGYVSLLKGIPQWAKDMYKTQKVGGYCPGQFAEDEEHSLVYKVTFKNKQGTIIDKFWHKTHHFAFTIKEPGKEPYTLIADKAMNAYNLKMLGELKHKKYDTSHWATRHPEPDDFNPYKDDPKYSHVTRWKKACEWWPEDTH